MPEQLPRLRCTCCDGKGYIEITMSILPETERVLLKALRDGQERQAGDLPSPGSTQRMALKRLEDKGLVSAVVVDRAVSHRNHRYGYTITEAGKTVLREGS